MDWRTKTGDTSPAIEYYLQDYDLEPINLIDASVKFQMKEANSDTVLIDSSATIVDENEGRVKYEWQEGDTDTAGNYHAEWEVTYSDGTIETFPKEKNIIVTIIEDIG